MTGRRRRGENNFTEGRVESYGVVRWALKRNAPVDSSSERAAKDHLVGFGSLALYMIANPSYKEVVTLALSSACLLYTSRCV